MLIDNFDTLCAAGKRTFKPHPNEGMGKMQIEKTNKQTCKQKRTNNPKDMQIWPENNSKHLVPLPAVQVT